MRLAVFYLAVSLSYMALRLTEVGTARVVFPFVALLLLAPAVYAEWLRLVGRARGGDRARS